MNTAFFCIPAHGHTNPTLAVVRELTARGHAVRYYTTVAFRAKVEAAGAVFVPFDTEAARPGMTAADGTPLTVAPGKSFIAIWGGYYGQALRLTAADGSEQTLPEKPALLASGVTDEAAAAAEAALSNAQKLIDAQAAIDQANASLAEAQTELQDAQAALDADSENADLLAARDAAQAKIDELNQTIADNQAYLDANSRRKPRSRRQPMPRRNDEGERQPPASSQPPAAKIAAL